MKRRTRLLGRWFGQDESELSSAPAATIPRPEVLQVPDPPAETEFFSHLRSSQSEQAADESEPAYRVRYDSDQLGPKWDPYDEEQSRANRIKSARRRPEPGQRLEYDRWAIKDKPPTVTHYQLLGVPPDATAAVIERAYRRYVADIHPDKFFDDPERRKEAESKLRELNAIMQILRDPLKRAQYDDTL